MKEMILTWLALIVLALVCVFFLFGCAGDSDGVVASPELPAQLEDGHQWTRDFRASPWVIVFDPDELPAPDTNACDIDTTSCRQGQPKVKVGDGPPRK